MSEHSNKYNFNINNMSEHSDKYYLGIDIGGSHISSALIDCEAGELLETTLFNSSITSNGNRELILNEWKCALKQTVESLKDYSLCGIGVAVPGPFDYDNGICLMQEVNKYSSLYGVDVAKELRNMLGMNNDVPIVFENDAACFGMGESLQDAHKNMQNIIAITLGTGFGSAFIHKNQIIKESNRIPPHGELYSIPYLDGICEDYISSKWILNSYNTDAPQKADSVYTIAKRAMNEQDKKAIRIFCEFGKHLAGCLNKWVHSFNADCLVIGGSIARSSSLFLPSLKKHLQNTGSLITIKISEFMELSAIKGAAVLAENTTTQKSTKKINWRKSSQALMPQHLNNNELRQGDYILYPSFNIGDNKIFTGFDSLGAWLASKQYVMIDGIAGNDWQAMQNYLSVYFKEKNIPVKWYETSQFILAQEEIETLVQPFVSEDGDVWGKRTTLGLEDFFLDDIRHFKPGSSDGLHILIGTGAALANWSTLVYVEVPKNEIQYRMRAGQSVSIINTVGFSNPEIYKRLYFVDWVMNNRHKQSIYEKINVVADSQWRDNISWAFADSVYNGLKELSKNPIRVRPWFEAGAWGGQWLKNHVKELNQDEVNYAWSFELIVPENGIVLESNGYHLEIAFDWLMEREGENILGEDYKTFGSEFPIRFDYLDTVDGGNLSIQCHPSLDYIRNEFGENITQDETYYILDCKEDAQVYLGFQENINPQEFRNVLEESADKNVPVNITDYVQAHNAKKHDLFLIPNQTIHSAGKNNLVLEISATPYIFTFKMYDWLRFDLEGNPRPINIEHAFKNLDFSRKGKKVTEELISKPSVIEEKDDYTLVHLPTHQEHFYDIHRIEFTSAVQVQTNNKCFIMMLVEGTSVLIKTGPDKTPVRFNYAETFVIPAAIEKFEIINETKEPVKVIKAFVK